MARIKQVGPSVLAIALIAGVFGYILGCTQQQREQDAHAQTQEPAETATVDKDVESTSGGQSAEQGGQNKAGRTFR